ncbi:MAG: hypothetical protein AAGB48_05320 [Planctomycetota bacterium]
MSRPTDRVRGFVMPVVVLLALVGGLVVGVAMERAAQRVVITQEQLDAYSDSHRSFGIKSIIASWLRFSDDQDMNAMRGVRDADSNAEGVIFRTDPVNGIDLSVSLQPWQGRLLIVGNGLPAEQAQQVQAMADALRASVGNPERFQQITRRVGPPAIDAGRAPPEVISIVAATLLEDALLGSKYANELVRARRSETVDRALLLAAAERASLDEAQRSALEPWFTPDPVLWRCAAELTEQDTPGRAGDDKRTRYTGIVMTPDDALATSGAISGHELFLTWERDPVRER